MTLPWFSRSDLRMFLLAPDAAGVDSFAGPSWDNRSEYPSLTAPELAADVARAQELVASLEELSKSLSSVLPRADVLLPNEVEPLVARAQELSRLEEDASRIISSLVTFATCALSVDGRDVDAKSLLSRLQSLHARARQAAKPLALFLTLTNDAVVERYLAAPQTAPQRFLLSQQRQLKNQALPLSQEELIIGLGVNGPTAWGDLYDTISGSIQCEVALPSGTKHLGLAATAALLENPDVNVRQAAYKATNAAWQIHEETCAAVINSLAGWRHEIYRRRSSKTPVHYLDQPLHEARISRATLDAMMSAVIEARDVGRRAVRAHAKGLGEERLGPWDLFAPPPQGTSGRLSFAQGLNLVADAFATVAPDMGDFVRMMADRKWIEGTVSNHKRPGAYCTGFLKTRSPRVYMTYTGGMKDLLTLSHELGHAFHSWVMRDLPLAQTEYPMTLAETASIFAETLVADVLAGQAKTTAERFNIAWAEARAAEAFILNIPARFAFERQVYEKRAERTLTPADLKEMMAEAWNASYGDTLVEPNSLFWASKLHFHISDLSFYNFPYTFGYLFALGVYAQKEKLGAKFYPAYAALLRDTGRMSAEAVATKHLGVDLTQPDFWRQSLAIVAERVSRLEQLV